MTERVLCLGVFDGVHRGHQVLAQTTQRRAEQLGLQPAALSFDPHPAFFFSDHKRQQLLTLPERRAELMALYGIDKSIFAAFDQKFADQSPAEFVHFLVHHLNARALVVGPDYRFGRQREGDIKTLRRLGEGVFELSVVDEVLDDTLRFRSSELRRALDQGDMKKFGSLSGRCFDFLGRVVAGQGRGAGLGFATANLSVDERQLLPATGVYALRVEGDNLAALGVMNLGHSPTLRGPEGALVPEVHLLDFEGDLYGQDLRVFVVERLRSERSFDSLQALVSQVGSDIAQARIVLNS
ncbi:MAG: riboflavin biosynthesis protein RibF [Myxococcota bacterium]|nr:riboflavin biosynthesis protein RibF [Myxococcota bacterium]